MKRVLLIVWSGTGNTLKVAELIRHSFTVRGWEAEIVDCTRASAIVAGGAAAVDTAGSTGAAALTGADVDVALSAAGIAGDTLARADIVGLGYPVYAFNTPAAFLRCAKTLPLGDKPVFIFKTSGEPSAPNNGSSHRLIRLSGFRTLLGEYHFLMPYNIIFRFPDNLVKQMYLAAKRQSGILADNIITGKTSFIKYGLLHRLVSWIFRIQGPGARLNGRLYGVRRDRCTLCMRCLRDCPAGNIRLVKGRFRFGWNCMMCMRCSLYCPADALRIGLLDLWRVNGPFCFETLEKDETLDGRFITGKTRGLYRIYISRLA
ncbi:MAG: EFR1 family ferrodoxin [Treponema sp.]|jgi:NAD-dependent dihydropyrimidine dehydrogenase PreA subunit|nr:EFR1 family ferrodoxin [Treponema sp.]